MGQDPAEIKPFSPDSHDTATRQRKTRSKCGQTSVTFETIRDGCL